MNLFPLQDAGSLSCINPSVLQRSSFEAVASSDRYSCLDTLDNSIYRQGNRTSDVRTSTQSHQAQSTTASIGTIPSTYPSYFAQVYPFPAMASDTTRRDDGRHHSHQSPRTAIMPHQDTSLHRSTRLASIGKRNLDSLTYSPNISSNIIQRPAKLLRVNQTHDQARKSNSYNHTRSNRQSNRLEVRSSTGTPQINPTQNKVYKLRGEQKDFIRHWFKSIAKGQEKPYLAIEEIDAFATLVKAPPQAIREYVQKKLKSTKGAENYVGLNVSEQGGIKTEGVTHQSYSQYTLREANKHLDDTTLDSIEKYVSASQRRRTQSDGRRSVNQGPYRCTFGCGYRTKRSFDWRRHEETHEPQELWLCHFCKQKGDINPFLVNRKDKFLQHVKDSHIGRDAEDVLEISFIDFRAKFNPQCPICPHTFQTWDERCKHVLSHFEDEIYPKKLQQARDVSSPESGSVSDEQNFPTDAFTPSSSSSNEDDTDPLTSRQYSPSDGRGNVRAPVMIEDSVRSLQSQLSPSC